MPAIGLDIGGTKTELVVLSDGAVAQSRTELLRRREPTPRAYDDLVALVRALVFDAERAVGATCTVGVGAPGSPNPVTGLHRNSNLTSMNGRAFQADLRSALGRTVRVSNDANCMTLSEAVDGAASDAPRDAAVFGVIIGTGVGGGVVIGRRVLDGAQGVAGEWGHNPMPAEAMALGAASAASAGIVASAPHAQCYCGRASCLELFLAGPALERRYAARAGRDARAADLASLASTGDAHAAAILDWYAGALACALGTVVNVLDPHTIVLAGGLSNLSDLAPRVQAALAKYVFSDSCATRVVRAVHGDSSGVRGAAWLGQAG